MGKLTSRQVGEKQKSVLRFSNVRNAINTKRRKVEEDYAKKLSVQEQMPERNDEEKKKKKMFLSKTKREYETALHRIKQDVIQERMNRLKNEEKKMLLIERKKRDEERKKVEEELNKYVNPNWVESVERVSKELAGLKRLISHPKKGAVKISNLPNTVTVKKLGAELEQYGEIKLLNVKEDTNDPKRSIAYVFFQKAGVASEVTKKLDHTVLMKKVVKVNFVPPSNISVQMFRVKVAADED